ncbi:MAG: C40 family peptidase [Clostridia bacterium]|nr:C40 family peptidase [Clostridia bacterium]
MQDEGQPKSKLRFTQDDQPETTVLESRQMKKLTRSKNPLAASRLQLTEAELGEPKLEKPLPQAEKTADKVSKAKARITKKKNLAITRATDEATGKTTPRLRFEEKAALPSRLLHEALPSPSGEIHRQVAKAEDENVGVEAAHGVEKGAESTVRFTNHSSRTRKLNAHRAAGKVEQKLDKANIRVLQKKEQLSSNPISRWQQKRAIRQSYTRAKAAGSAGANTVRHAATTARSNVTQGVKNLFVRKKKSFVLGGLLFLMLAMVMNGLSSCTMMFQTGMQAFVIGTYPAEDADILAAERAYRKMEDELQNEVDNYPSFHPGYDEYIYDLDEIWHDPHALISLISARMGGEWTIDDVYGTLNVLFEKQYTLTQTVTSETRYRKELVTHYEKHTNPDTGEVTWVPYEVMEDVPYTYRICSVTLLNFNLSHLPFYVLSRQGVSMYAVYISVLGNREYLFRGWRYASTLRAYTRYDIPEELLEDETFARIIAEAEKYLGYPYVWGGDSPETSFDCSGFVSYVFTNSGVRNVGRLGATGLYGACKKITAEEARPGDLVFFEGTIPRADGVTHVGIYVGNGWMIHCGSPIGYANLSDSYFKQHFFGYGRLVQN